MLSSLAKPQAVPRVGPDVVAWGRQFDDLTGRLGPRFRRREPRERLQEYLRALLSPIDRKNGWQIAEHAGDAGPEQMQRFVSTASWDEDGVRDDLRQYVGEHLGDPSGVLVVDETGFLKKGEKSAGVQRQYSGTAGRVENCQVGVFLAYASAKGCAFIDRDLYLPKLWTDDRERCREAGIPDETEFATKPELARQMLERAQAARMTAAWVTADEVYGGNPALRKWLQSQEQAYVMAVAKTETVQVLGLRDPNPLPAQALVAWLEIPSWYRLSAGAGSKGLRVYDWTCLPLVHADGEGWQHWLLARRQIRAPHEIAYYRAFGPAGTPLAELVRVAGMRWSIEVAFEGAKQEAGLDEYEVRRWTGWYRHVTLSMLAHAFLVVVRRHAWDEAQGKKGAGTKRLFRLQPRRSGGCSAESCGTGPRSRSTSSTGPIGGASTNSEPSTTTTNAGSNNVSADL